MTLDDAIANFVKAADQATADYYRQAGFAHQPPTHRADYISDKWVRVVTVELRDGSPTASSAYAFIARQDGHTKTLGTVHAGGIHKPASFKAPAKHQRANVLDPDFHKAITPFGIVYLK